MPENNEMLIRKYNSILSEIKSRWMDEIGKEYVKWLESNLVHFEKYEKSREILTLKKTKIKLICDDITEHGDDDSKKRRVLKR